MKTDSRLLDGHWMRPTHWTRTGAVLGVLACISAQQVRADPRPALLPAAGPAVTPALASTSTPDPSSTARSPGPKDPAATLAPTAKSSAIRTAVQGPACAWSYVPSPNTGSPNNEIRGVAAIASDDVWAVGAYGNLGVQAWQLIEHWDGTRWSLVPTPPLSIPNELMAVSAVASDDVWAVGGYDTGGQSLIEHWNGSLWSVVANPNPGTFNRFFGVAAISSQDVWAVGQYHDGGLSKTLVEHWDGAGWSVVPSPNLPGQHNLLHSVTAVPGSPNELWAVGAAGPSALILHWNGAQWSLVSSPNAGVNPILTSVVAISANDVWAVGYTGGNSGTVTLTEHWDGSTWSVVQSPNPSSTYNYLWGVGAAATNDVWAVGDFNATGGNGRSLILRWNGTAWVTVPGGDSGPSGLSFTLKAVDAIGASDVWSVGTKSHSLAEHWDGTQWSTVATPNAGVGDNILTGVSGSASTDVWEVGYFSFGTERRTLIEHWDGATWSIVPSPNTGKRINVLDGVVAISASSAWAVGSATSGNALDQTTLILHWDGTGWSIVPSPSPGTAGLNELHAVAANSASDVWAVGNFTNVGGFIQTLVVHWNGAHWSVIPSANVPGTNNGLFGVVALGPNDVWAVGYQGVAEFATLIQHWDGSTWSVVPSPDPQVSSNILRAVSAASANDISAVGTSKNLYTSMTGGLTEHWDGSSWSLVYGAGGVPSTLFGVAASSPGDAWAVGDRGGTALISRWDGSGWGAFPSPDVAGRLLAATAITASDVWAVGQRYVEGIGFQTLNEHFTCDVELFCFCDAGGGCANPDHAAGCANSTGSGALLSQGGGSTSVAADDLVLSAVQLPPNKPGIFFMGGAPTSIPFFDGRRCVAAGSSGLFRYPLQSSGPAGIMTLGPGIVAHSQSFATQGRIQAGDVWYFQTWYRDAAGPCGFRANLSNAMKVTFRP